MRPVRAPHDPHDRPVGLASAYLSLPLLSINTRTVSCVRCDHSLYRGVCGQHNAVRLLRPIRSADM